MIATECPFCGVRTTFETIKSLALPPFLSQRLTASRGYDAPTYEVVRCLNDACGMALSLVVGPKGDTWVKFPQVVVSKSFPDVPDHVASAAEEAFRCLGVDATRGAVVLARAVIEATAKDKKVKGDNLWAKIDALAEQGFIPESARLAAHEVRFAGNDVAHGDLVENPLEVEDAATILELMSVMLASVYQEPAKITRVTQSRLARSVKVVDSGSPEGVET